MGFYNSGIFESCLITPHYHSEAVSAKAAPGWFSLPPKGPQEVAAPWDYCCRTKPLAKPQQTDRKTAHFSQLWNRDYSPDLKNEDIRIYPVPSYTEKYSHTLLHKEEFQPVELESPPLKGPCPVLVLQVRASVKSAEISSEDDGLKETLKCNFPELQGTEGRDWVPSSSASAPRSRAGWHLCRQGTLQKPRGVLLSSLQWSQSGRVWLQQCLGFWLFKCTGKGTLFAPNKICLGLAFLTGARGKEARQQLK